MTRRRWRCFHCDAVFRSEHEAGIHFGADEAGTCACVLPHEQHLVEHIRDLERQLDSYRNESDRVMRSIMTLEGEHQRALIREEEKGYERGLRDARYTETRDLIQTLLDNDPNEPIADNGMTVLDGWRARARVLTAGMDASRGEREAPRA